MIGESRQDTLINWPCLGKFCFLFWLLFARLPTRPPQFSFFSAQNLNVIPISCSKTVCLFHKTDMGGRDYYIIVWQAFNKTLLGNILIVLLTSVSLTKKTKTKVKLIGKFPAKVQTWKGIYKTNCSAPPFVLHYWYLSFAKKSILFVWGIHSETFVLTQFYFDERKLSVPEIRMIGTISARYCHFPSN